MAEENSGTLMSAELTPYLQPDQTAKLLKSRSRLRLRLEKLLLERAMTQKPRSKVANVVVVPKHNLDVEAFCSEALPFAENDLAGNYGVGPKEGIKEFFGDNVPLFKSSNCSLVEVPKSSLTIIEKGLSPEVSTANNVVFEPVLEAELKNLEFELFGN